MDELSHWDFAFEFSGHEAACLIQGLDPYRTTVHAPEIVPVVNLMRSSYEQALWAHQDSADLDERRGGMPKAHLDFVYPVKDRRIFAQMKAHADTTKVDPLGLYSARMSAYEEQIDRFIRAHPSRLSEGIWELDKDRFNRWLCCPEQTAFEAQKFSRHELRRWLCVRGLNAQYRFNQSRDGASFDVAADGQHDSGPVGHLFLMMSKRDVLSPVIELAASQCRNQKDLAEIWPRLQELARKQTPPLIGVTPDGVQYLDDADAPKEFTKRALRERLRRLSNR